MMQAIQFVLVPDGSAARRLRRILATQSPSMGIVVGTWPELIEQARSAYVIAPQVSDWKSQFHAALEQLPDAFWSNSLRWRLKKWLQRLNPRYHWLFLLRSLATTLVMPF